MKHMRQPAYTFKAANCQLIMMMTILNNNEF